jgi:hypothetical protein
VGKYRWFNRHAACIRGSGVDKEQLPKGLRSRDITQTSEIVEEDDRYGELPQNFPTNGMLHVGDDKTLHMSIRSKHHTVCVQ